MYHCNTVIRLLYPYLDGELDLKESLKLQKHLEECSCCSGAFRREKEFILALKASDSLPVVPAHLRDRINKDLEILEPLQVSSSVVSSSRFIFAPAFLVTMTAMFLLILSGIILYAPSTPVKKRSQELVKAVVEYHELITKDKGTCDVPGKPPKAQTTGIYITCGKLINIRGEDASILTLESAEGNVSFLQVKSRPRRGISQLVSDIRDSILFRKLRNKPQLVKYSGYYTLTWTDSSYKYALVSYQRDRIEEACQVLYGCNKQYQMDAFDKI